MPPDGVAATRLASAAVLAQLDGDDDNAELLAQARRAEHSEAAPPTPRLSSIRAGEPRWGGE